MVTEDALLIGLRSSDSAKWWPFYLHLGVWVRLGGVLTADRPPWRASLNYAFSSIYDDNPGFYASQDMSSLRFNAFGGIFTYVSEI